MADHEHPEELAPDEALIHGGDEETVADTVGEHAHLLEAAPEGAARPGLKSTHNRKVILVPLVAALVFFFGPAAGFIAGDRADAIDNRPLVDLPSVTEGWNFIPNFQAWANDYLPLRSQAVRAGTKLSDLLFNEPPNYGRKPESATVPGVGTPDVAAVPEADGAGGTAGSTPTAPAIQYPSVIQGKDGWLYFGADVGAVCQPIQPIAESVAEFKKLGDAVTASGRKFVLLIPPDKSSVVPEYLPDSFAGQSCMAEAKAEFWKQISAIDGLTVIDPRASLAVAQQEWGQNLWRKTDTHWGPRGALVFAQDLVAALDPSLENSTTFDSPGTVQLPGDLAGMLGTPAKDEVKGLVLQRPGVQLSFNGAPIAFTDVPGLIYSLQTTTATTTDAPLYPGKTFILGDSFFEASKNMIAPFFESMTYIHNMTGDIPGATPVVAQAMVDSDTIVYEVVERAAVGGVSSFQHPDNVDALIAALQANPR